MTGHEHDARLPAWSLVGPAGEPVTLTADPPDTIDPDLLTIWIGGTPGQTSTTTVTATETAGLWSWTLPAATATPVLLRWAYAGEAVTTGDYRSSTTGTLTPDGTVTLQVDDVTVNIDLDQGSATAMAAAAVAEAAASQAATAAGAAEGAAAAAGQSATDAATSADAATTARAGAEQARDDAEAARDAAEGHAGTAEAAATEAAGSADAAAGSAAGASDASDTAAGHAAAAGTARTGAESARDEAQAAKDAAEAAMHDMAALSAMELIPCTGFGDSFLLATGHTSGAGYADRVRSRLRMGTFVNRAVGGAHSNDVAILAFGNTASKWVTPTTAGHWVLVNVGINDLARQADAAQKRTSFENSLRHLLATLTAASRVDDVAATTVAGTWTTLTSTVVSGGTRRASTVQGSTIDFPFTGDVVVLTLYGLDDAAVAPGGAIGTITDVATGAVLATVNTSNQGKRSVQDTQNTWAPMAVRLAGFGSGAHSVRITHSSPGGRFLIVDDALVPSSAPPGVVVNLITYLAPAGYANNGGHANDALVDVYNQIIVTVCAEYPSVVVADTVTGWDPAIHVASDGVHPNDRGSAHIADAVIAAVRTVGFVNGPNALTVP